MHVNSNPVVFERATVQLGAVNESLAGCSLADKPVDDAGPSYAVPVVPAVPCERPPNQPISAPSDSYNGSSTMNTSDSSTSTSDPDTNPNPWSQHMLMNPQKICFSRSLECTKIDATSHT